MATLQDTTIAHLGASHNLVPKLEGDLPALVRSLTESILAIEQEYLSLRLAWPNPGGGTAASDEQSMEAAASALNIGTRVGLPPSISQQKFQQAAGSVPLLSESICHELASLAALWIESPPLTQSMIAGGDEGFMRRTGAQAYTVHKSNLTAVVDPTVNDDSGAGYVVGSIWLNLANDTSFTLTDASVGAALWTREVRGPATSSNFTIPYWNGTTGQKLADLGTVLQYIPNGGTTSTHAIRMTNADLQLLFGTVDNVDVSSHTHSGVGTGGAQIPVGNLSGMTAKGDLLARDATVPVRLAVGTDGKVLTADSAATEGVSWQTPSPGFTVEEAQDAVGTILLDSARIDFTYNDGTPSITADIISGSIGETQLGTNAVTNDKILDGTIALAKLANISSDRLLGRDTAGLGIVQQVQVTGGIEFTGSTSIQIATDGVTTTKILAANVTNAKLDNMAEATFKMRAAGAGTGVPIDGTAAQALTALAEEYELAVTFVGPAVDDEQVIRGIPAAATITKVSGVVKAATNAGYSVIERTRSTPFSTSGDSTIASQTATTTIADATLSDSSVAADKCIVVKVTSISGTPVKLLVYVRYKLT